MNVLQDLLISTCIHFSSESIFHECEFTYRADARLLGAWRWSALTEAGVHHGVKSVSRQSTTGTATQAGQSRLGQGAQHRLQGSRDTRVCGLFSIAVKQKVKNLKFRLRSRAAFGPWAGLWTRRFSINGIRFLTWKMESADLAAGRVVTVMVFSAESHSWMVTILRAGAGMWRFVSRAFFRWWKSPSVRVYLRTTWRERMKPLQIREIIREQKLNLQQRFSLH